MKTQTKIITSIAVAAILVTGGLFAAERTAAGTVRGRIAERLAGFVITEEQKAQAKAILREHRATAEPLIKSFVAERRVLRDLTHAEKVDEAAIRVQVEKVAKVGADLAVERAKIAHEMRGVLTPEQIQQLGEMREDVEARIDQFLDHVAKRIAED